MASVLMGGMQGTSREQTHRGKDESRKTAENYEAIRTILEQEYGDKQKLLTTYMDELQGLDPVKEVSGMKPTLNQCRSIWQNMETLKGKWV